MSVTAIYPVIQIQELSATKETIALPEPLRRSRERDVSCGCTNGPAQLAKFTSAPATSVSVPVSRSTLGNSLTGGAPPVRFSIFSKAAVLRRSVLQGRTFVAKASSRNIFTWHDSIKIRQNRVFYSLCFSSILNHWNGAEPENPIAHSWQRDSLPPLNYPAVKHICRLAARGGRRLDLI